MPSALNAFKGLELSWNLVKGQGGKTHRSDRIIKLLGGLHVFFIRTLTTAENTHTHTPSKKVRHTNTSICKNFT